MGIRGGAFPKLAATVAMLVLLSGCTSYESSQVRTEPAVSCTDVLTTVLHRVKTDDTAGAINAELDWLSSNCSSQYDVFVDYVSGKSSAEQFGTDTCDSLSDHFGSRAIELLRADGLCETAVTPVETVQQPGGGIAWNEAAAHAGTTQRVCGPFAGGGNSYDDVFLNLGRDYPDPARFQIVVWDIGALEPIAGGVTLCTSGRITLYEGVAQIELYDPSSIEIYE